jgi:hypothetical protein
MFPLPVAIVISILLQVHLKSMLPISFCYVAWTMFLKKVVLEVFAVSSVLNVLSGLVFQSTLEMELLAW